MGNKIKINFMKEKKLKNFRSFFTSSFQMGHHIRITQNNINSKNTHDLSGLKDLQSKILDKVDPDITQKETHNENSIEKDQNKCNLLLGKEILGDFKQKFSNHFG